MIYLESEEHFSENRLLLEFSVLPAFARPLSCQFYESENHIELYWKYGLAFEEFINAKQKCFGEKAISFSELKKNEIFHQYLNREFPPEHSVLMPEQAELVRRLYHEGLPSGAEITYGCDGHSYSLKIYGASVRNYRTWCILPEAWKLFGEVIDISVKIIRPEHIRIYAVHGYH